MPVFVSGTPEYKHCIGLLYAITYIENDKRVCTYDYLKIIAFQYLAYGCMALSLLVVVLSALIKKPYAWIILHQTLCHILYELFTDEIDKFFLNNIPNRNVYYLLEALSQISPFIPTLFLAINRFLGICCPNFYDRYVTNKTIFLWILLWDLATYGSYGIWTHIWRNTDWRSCPQFNERAICQDRNVSQFYQFRYRYDDESFMDLAPYDAVIYFDEEDLKNANIDYEECFEYKRCKEYRLFLPPKIEYTLYAVLSILTGIITLAIFYLIAKHFKRQLKINKKSFYTSIKISVILLFQSLMLLLFSILSIEALEPFFDGVLKPFTTTWHLRNAGLVYYFTIDFCLILFLLNDYRYYVTYFIPKRQQNVIKSTTKVLSIAG